MPPQEQPAPDAAPRDSLLRAEDGMITVLSLISVFGFAVLAALVGSVGTAINRKIDTQNAADAVALSCAVQNARTLNGVTAVNHLTGELLAVVILQEALGGERPGSGQARDTKKEDQELDDAKLITSSSGFNPTSHDFVKQIAQAGANSAPPMPLITPAYEKVRAKSQGVKFDNALLDAHRELKTWLALVYRLKVPCMFLIAVPFDVPIVGWILNPLGKALYGILTAIEFYIIGEWGVLKFIEGFARATSPLRTLIYGALPLLNTYAKGLVVEGVIASPRTARAIGALNNASGAVHPPVWPLPISPEKVKAEKPETDSRIFWLHSPPKERDKPDHWGDPPEFAYSQVIRGAYPWVNFHRQAVFKLTKWLTLADFPKHYRNWTTEVTLRRSQHHYSRSLTRLYVLDDVKGDRKKEAPWINDTSAAERAFTVVGFAHKGPPYRWNRKLLPPVNEKGVVTFAQAMVYNANPRKPDPDDTNYQPVTGWDTLNWDNEGGDPAAAATVEWPHFKRTESPRVKLNWQAKLVPVSRLGEASLFLLPPFRDVLKPGPEMLTTLPAGH